MSQAKFVYFGQLQTGGQVRSLHQPLFSLFCLVTHACYLNGVNCVLSSCLLQHSSDGEKYAKYEEVFLTPQLNCHLHWSQATFLHQKPTLSSCSLYWSAWRRSSSTCITSSFSFFSSLRLALAWASRSRASTSNCSSKLDTWWKQNNSVNIGSFELKYFLK